MEPENQPLEKEIPFGNHHFQVPCSSRAIPRNKAIRRNARKKKTLRPQTIKASRVVSSPFLQTCKEKSGISRIKHMTESFRDLQHAYVSLTNPKHKAQGLQRAHLKTTKSSSKTLSFKTHNLPLIILFLQKMPSTVFTPT